MITYLLFSLPCSLILTFLFLTHGFDHGIESKLGKIFMSFLNFLIAQLLVSLILIPFDRKNTDIKKTTHKYEIYSTDPNASVFMIPIKNKVDDNGTEKQYYYFYQKINNGYIIRNVDVSNTIVKISPDNKAKLSVVYKIIVSRFGIYQHSPYEKSYYILYLPKNHSIL